LFVSQSQALARATKSLRQRALAAPATLRRMTTLFDPLQLGDIALANRVVMAPLTRDRAAAGRVPHALNAQYYAQRADPASGAGLIISEGTQVAPLGQGYLDTPGIYSPEQLAGWRQVTDAVHARGGRIVAQIWHVGRISHTSLLPAGEQPVSATAKVANTKTFTPNGFDPVSPPRALTTDEVAGVVQQFRQAARNAIDAGFDGIEVHGANGYLVEQFLRDSCNDRTDRYGGSIENRARFLVEVMAAVCAEIGPGRVGLRLSPVTPANDIGQDSNPFALFSHVVDELAKLRFAFIEVVEGATGGPRDFASFDFAALRKRWPGAWLVNNGYTRDMALETVASGRADAISFGKPFIANPDLARRLREDRALATPNQATFYGGGAEGYTDYPALAD
jgi:N-ethylmaleimide reductase